MAEAWVAAVLRTLTVAKLSPTAEMLAGQVCKRRRSEQVQEPRREINLSYQQAMGGSYICVKVAES